MADSATTEGVGLPEPATLEVGDEGDVSRETSSEAAAEGATEGATEREEGEGAEGTPGSEQAQSLFQELLTKDDEPSQESKEELPPEVKPGTRAAEAIVGLRQRAQRAESEHANLQQVLGQQQQQFQSWANNLQQQFQQMQLENARLQERLAVAPRQPTAPKTEAEAYMDQFREQVRQDIAQKELAPLKQQLEAQQQQYQAWQQQQQQQAQRAQIERDAQVFQAESAKFWRNTVLREVPQDADVPGIDVGKYLVLAAQAYNPQFAANPEAAARMIRRTILETADLIQRYAGNSARKALDTGKKDAATSIPRGAADGSTRDANPNMDVLLANGFDSPMDWKDAGRPRLKPVKVA